MQVADFLKKHHFEFERIDTQRMLDDLYAEMNAGLTGGNSSVPMLPSFIGAPKATLRGCDIAAVDAGGTNLRVVRVHFNDHGVPALVDCRRAPMPGTAGEISGEQCFDVFCRLSAGVVRPNELFGFCFSYPSESSPDGDARLLYWTKNVQVPSLVGQRIGQGLSQHLTRHGIVGTRAIVLNDTTAACLASYAAADSADYVAHVGFILGTGTNTAYTERTQAITKLQQPFADDHMIINCETGNFSKAPRSDFDYALDRASLSPNAYTFEKMIAGAFLGQLCTIMLLSACDEGLLSHAVADKLATHVPSLAELNDFATVGGTLFGTDPQDQVVATQLIVALYTRAAVYTAVNIAAAVIKAHHAAPKPGPICINANGSTFYKTTACPFQEIVEAHLKELLAPQGITYRICKIDEAPLIGAAVAAWIYQHGGK